jgi:hypothetical protein
MPERRAAGTYSERFGREHRRQLGVIMRVFGIALAIWSAVAANRIGPRMGQSRDRKFRPAALGLLFLGLSAVTSVVNAADANIRCVQTFLEFKGYDPGPLDGATGKRTFAAAAAYRKDSGATIDDLSAATAPAWCDLAKSDAKFATLIGYSYGTEPLWNDGATSKTYDQVLVGDSVGNFVAADRNIQAPSALSYVDLQDGLVAARILVKYSDKGHKEDWFYNGAPGVQQRFEVTETRPFSMLPGKTYWLRMSVFIPDGATVAKFDQTVLTDLKPMVNGLLLDPILNLKLGDKALQMDHIIGRPQACVIGYSSGGGENTICDVSKEQDFIAPIEQITGQWMNFVYRVHWANDETGRFHLWMNDKLVTGIAGNTLHDAEFITNKFGIYRGFYGSQGTPQPDARVYFAGVGRSETCEGLGLGNCTMFEADVETVGSPGVYNRNFVNVRDMTEYLAGGGRVMKGKGEAKTASIDESAFNQLAVHLTEKKSIKPGHSDKVLSILEGRVEQHPDVSEFDFMIDGQFAYAIDNFVDLSFYLTNNAEMTDALKACPRPTLKFDDGTEHVAIRFTKVKDDFVSINATCLIDALSGEQQVLVKLLTENFTHIAAGAKFDGSIDKMKNDGLKIFLNRVADGEIKLYQKKPT